MNHVWSSDEVDARLSAQPRHEPVHLSEKLAHGFLQVCYKVLGRCRKAKKKQIVGVCMHRNS